MLSLINQMECIIPKVNKAPEKIASRHRFADCHHEQAPWQCRAAASQTARNQAPPPASAAAGLKFQIQF